jgi:hypothetical protein
MAQVWALQKGGKLGFGLVTTSRCGWARRGKNGPPAQGVPRPAAGEQAYVLNAML